MLITAQWFIYHVSAGSFFRRSGEEIPFLKVFYLDSASSENSQNWKGYKVQNIDVLSFGFTLSDFTDCPGFYEVSYTPSAVNGKVSPKIVNVKFVKKFDFSKSDGLLVLGVKRFAFTPQDSKEFKKGLKVFAINLDDLQETSESFGYPELSFSFDVDMRIFKSVPGFYNFDLSYERGRSGQSILKASKCTFLNPFSFGNVSQQPVSS